jgi:hypothetical protein
MSKNNGGLGDRYLERMNKTLLFKTHMDGGNNQ